MLRAAQVSRRHTCWNNLLEMIPIWICTLYIGCANRATFANVIWEEYSFANITDEDGPTSILAAAFSISKESAGPVDGDDFQSCQL